MRLLSALILGTAAVIDAAPALAQCPDGTPPPCARAAARVPSPNSVAVLLFENRANDTSLTLLAEGLAEQIATNLQQLQRLEVKSPAAVRFVLGQGSREPGRIGRALGARYLVDGSLLPGRGTVRVSVQLVEAARGTMRWSGTFQRPTSDPFAVISAVADSVAMAIIGELAPLERARLARRPTRDSTAYELFVRARALTSRFTEADERAATALYDAALARDPGFALAHAGAALAWSYIADNWMSPREAMDRARIAAGRALRLDSSIALAYLPLSYAAAQLDYEHDAAESLARRAIRLDPRLPEAHFILADFLAARHRYAEAVTEARGAWELDSLSSIVGLQYAVTLQRAGRYDEAFAVATLGGAREPWNPRWVARQAEARVAARRCQEASDTLAAHPESRSDQHALAVQAIVEACLGHTEVAQRLIAALVALANRVYVRPSFVADAYAAVGNLDEAFGWLDRAYDARDYSLLFVAERRWYRDQMHRDPRFADLLRRIRLELPPP